MFNLYGNRVVLEFIQMINGLEQIASNFKPLF